MGSSARINILGGLVRHAHVCAWTGPTFPSDSLLTSLFLSPSSSFLPPVLSLPVSLLDSVPSRHLSRFLELFFLPRDRSERRVEPNAPFACCDREICTSRTLYITLFGLRLLYSLPTDSQRPLSGLHSRSQLESFRSITRICSFIHYSF